MDDIEGAGKRHGCIPVRLRLVQVQLPRTMFRGQFEWLYEYVCIVRNHKELFDLPVKIYKLMRGTLSHT